MASRVDKERYADVIIEQSGLNDEEIAVVEERV
jgi:hypothetical protein